jgi:hypothetical protein
MHLVRIVCLVGATRGIRLECRRKVARQGIELARDIGDRQDASREVQLSGGVSVKEKVAFGKDTVRTMLNRRQYADSVKPAVAWLSSGMPGTGVGAVNRKSSFSSRHRWCQTRFQCSRSTISARSSVNVLRLRPRASSASSGGRKYASADLIIRGMENACRTRSSAGLGRSPLARLE